jgi:hypothetical protein
MAMNELVEIYEDSNEESNFELGFVRASNSETYTLNVINSLGASLGIYQGRTSDIHRINFGNIYLQSRQLMVQKSSSANPLKHDTSGIIADTFFETLMQAMFQKIIIKVIDYHGSDHIGFVYRVTNEHVEIRQVSSEGIENGLNILAMENIVRIDVDGAQERARYFLHSVRMGL